MREIEAGDAVRARLTAELAAAEAAVTAASDEARKADAEFARANEVLATTHEIPRRCRCPCRERGRAPR